MKKLNKLQKDKIQELRDIISAQKIELDKADLEIAEARAMLSAVEKLLTGNYKHNNDCSEHIPGGNIEIHHDKAYSYCPNCGHEHIEYI